MKIKIVTTAGFVETDFHIYKSSYHGIEVFVAKNPKGSTVDGCKSYIPITSVVVIHETPDDTPLKNVIESEIVS